MRLVDPGSMKLFVERVFTAAGLDPRDSSIVADHLVMASLRGVDSHGIVRVPVYIEGVEKGLVRPCGELRVLRSSGAVALCDGGGCMGIPVAAKATDLATDLASRFGVGVVGVRSLGHVGMLAYYTLRGAARGFVTLALANSPARVVPWGGCDPVFGTNPLSIAFPRRDGPAVVLDMATSVVADYRVHLAAERGEVFEKPIGLDRECRATRSPAEAMRGALLPFGEHKGYGIALAIELLTAAVIGALPSTEIPRHGSTQGGFLVAAVDPGVFSSPEEFLERAEAIVRRVKGVKRAPGVREVMVPGEPEHRVYEERSRRGIPVDDRLWKRLVELGRRFGVEPPTPLREHPGGSAP